MALDDVAVERVLRAVELLSPGRVVSYGDVGRLAGVSPRYVGTVLRLYGAEVAWWRVTTASGIPPEPVREAAMERWRGEGVPLRPDGRGCDLTAARPDLGDLAQAHAAACADLPA